MAKERRKNICVTSFLLCSGVVGLLLSCHGSPKLPYRPANAVVTLEISED